MSTYVRNANLSPKAPRKLRRLLASLNCSRVAAVKPRMDYLEPRVMLSTSTWTGGGANNNWSTAANWNGGVAPLAGDDLVFTGTAARLTNVNDLAAGTQFNSISFTGSGYAITGNDIFLHDGISQSVAGTNHYNGNLFLLEAEQTFTVSNASGVLDIGGTLSSFGVNTLTKDGPGTLQLDGTSTYDAGTALAAGTLEVDGTQSSSDISMSGGTLQGAGTTGSVTANGGLINAGVSGSGTVAVSGDLTLSSGSTDNIVLNGAGNSSQLAVSGNVALGSAALTCTVGYSSAIGDSFTIIDNQGSQAVSGTFAGLAQNATFTANGKRFRISYVGGDGNDVVVSQVADTTTTTLSANTNPTVFGQAVTFTAAVAGQAAGAAVPTGNVNFYDGGVLLGSGVLDGSGHATLATSALTRGSHNITATYVGDSNFQSSSTGSPLSQVINKTSTTATLGASAGVTAYGQALTLTATISAGGLGNGTPTGSVLFLDGTTTIGTANLSAGVATLVLPSGNSMAVGSHSFMAVYSGSTSFLSTATMPALAHTVSQASTTTAVASSSSTSTYRDSVTFTATVSATAPAGGVPGGTVTFSIDGTPTDGAKALNGSGQATLTLSTLTGGAHSITAAYTGTVSYGASDNTGAALTQTVEQAATTTTVSSSNSTSTYGGSVTFTAAVASVAGGIPTGTVTFSIDGVPMGGARAVDGAGHATYTLSSMVAGSRAITAVYSADTNYLTSTASTFGQSVAKAASTVTLASSGDNSSYGSSVTLTATVAGSTIPTGDVVFYEDAVALTGAVAVDGSGEATLVLPSISVGTHHYSVAYAGDTNYNTSSSSTLNQTVVRATTTTTLATDDNNVAFGTTVNLTAHVTSAGGSPGGTVKFYDGATFIGSAALDTGTHDAVLSLATLPADVHSITAVYQVSTSFATSTSGATTQTVTAATTTAAVVSNHGPSVFGQAVTLTATISNGQTANTPTGSVVFNIDGSDTAPVTLDGNGQATYTTSALDVNAHPVTVTYSNTDGNFAGSTSGALSQVVNLASTAVGLTATPTSPVYGQTIALAATVSVTAPGAGTISGNVEFYDGASLLGTTAVAGGQASLNVTTPAVGAHSYTAVYVGSVTLATSTSSAVARTVSQASTGITLCSSLISSTYGQAVTFTATATSGYAIPGGNVEFFDGAVSLGTQALDGSGVATYSTSALAAGSHSMTAVYQGNASFTASSASSVVSQEVAKASSAVGATPAAGPFAFSDSIGITVAVTSGGGTPTGTVTLKEGSTTITSDVLTGGGVVLSTSTLSAGTHHLTVVYGGDSNFSTATSSTVDITVNQVSTTTTVGVSGTPSTYGDSVTFTAAVASTAGTPTGTVSFYSDSVLLGTADLSAGTATYVTVAPLDAGAHTITASYAALGNYAASSDLVGGSQTVDQASSAIGVTVSAATPAHGSSVTFTATVTSLAGSPSGTVEFFDGATSLGTGAVNTTTHHATLSLSTLALGAHSVHANYSGDTDFASSTTAGDAATNVHSATTTTLATSNSGAVFGQSPTITVTVAATAPGAATPTGDVTFTLDGVSQAPVAVDGSGQATLVLTTPLAGTHHISAAYAGDAASLASSSSTLNQVIAPATTTLALASDNTSAVWGQQVTFTATLSITAPGAGSPTGSISFYDGVNLLGTSTYTGVPVTLADAALGVGSHSVTAVYTGDSNFNGSSGSAVNEAVAKASASAAVVSSDATSVFGETVTFTTTISAVAPGQGTPTGQVILLDGLTPISAAVSLSGGSATFTVSNFTVAAHSLTVVYGGDSHFYGTSNAVALAQGVSANATTTTVSSSSGTSVVGQSVTFTASVAADAPASDIPAGSVSFYDGATLLGTSALNGSGHATYTTSALSLASHSITAVYAGETTHSWSTSGVLTQTVQQASTTTALNVSTGTSAYHAAVTLTATVAITAPGGGTLSGSVEFFDGATSLGTAVLNGSNQAVLSVSSLSVASHSITAQYLGVANFGTSTSSSTSHTVTRAASTASVASSLLSSTYGDSVTFTATIASGSDQPTGTMTFYDGVVSLGTVALSSGSATLTTRAMIAGTHPITVSYSGDGNFLTSTSSAISQIVAAATPTVALAGPGAPAAFGDSITFTATVSAAYGTPTGTVNLYKGATLLGTTTLSAGSATFSVHTLPVGSDTITLNYLGDTNFAAGANTTSTTITNANTTTTLNLSSNHVTLGDSVTYTANVATGNTATATGSVSFYAGATLIGTANLDGSGHATLALASNAAGTFSISAVYGGAASFNGSTSSSTSATVDKYYPSTMALGGTTSPVFGSPMVIYATVNSSIVNPTGSVTFTVDGVAQAPVTLDGTGLAAITISQPSVGSHTISAVYSGDANFLTDSLGSVSRTVSKAATTANVSGTTTTSTFGDSVTFTATIAATGVTPTGSVTFFDGATSLGNVALDDSGHASLTITTLGTGAHAVDVQYAGNGNFVASTSTAANLAVGQIASTATLSAPASVQFGTTVTLSATVLSAVGQPSGNVIFYQGATALGTVALDGSGHASLAVPDLAVGSPSFSVAYAGDTNHATATSTLHTVNVTKADTTTTITPSSTTPTVGDSITVTIHVTTGTGAIASGQVALTADGIYPLGTSALDGSGNAQITFMIPAGGAHTLAAAYAGAASFNASQSTTASLTVARASAVHTFTATPPSSYYGTPFSLTATVTSPYTSPSGTVTFTVDGQAQAPTIIDGSGNAVLSLSNLLVGSHTITAAYSGDTNFLAANLGSASHTVIKAASSVGMNSSGTVDFGQAVTFTASVTSSATVPTGSVTFTEGSTVLGTVSLDGSGHAALAVSTLTAGSHSIIATYSGDSNFNTATSSTRSQIINTAATTISVLGSSALSYGSPATFTATVLSDAGTPNGVVTFFDGASAVGTGILNGSGVATLTTSALTAGTHTITASYGGAANYNISTSTAASQIINQATTTITVLSSATLSFGSPATFTATVHSTAGTPGGTVTFFDGDASLGTGTLNNSDVATLTTSALATGTHTITASYGGASNYAGSTSTGVSQVIEQATTTTTVLGSGTVSYGSTATFTATVLSSAGTPGGTVTFFDGVTSLGTGTLSSGVATLATSALTAGSHSITASYGGAADYAISTSTAASQPISKATTTTAVLGSGTVSFGGSVTFTATVLSGAGTPTGTVTFFDGATFLGTGTLSSGAATLTTSALNANVHTITASYGGAANYAGSTATGVAQTISKAPTATTVLGSGTVSYGASVTFTATVNSGAGTPAGTVTFFDGTTSLGTGTMSSGVATLATSTLTAGTHSITASYGSAANYATSTSTALSQVISKAATTTIMTSPQVAFKLGQSLTLNFTVASSAGSPAGTLTVLEGSTSLGTATVTAGTATLTLSNLALGSHILTASFAATDNYQASTSTTLTATVSPATAPAGHLDVTNSQTVAGWAYDSDTPTTPVQVRIDVDGQTAATITAGAQRSDLTSLGSTNHGFSYDLYSLPFGSHTVTAYALDTNGAPTAIGSYSFTSSNQGPFGNVDVATTSTFAGWAYDANTRGLGASPVQVRIDIDGQTAGTVTANLNRPDLTSLGTTNHGWSFSMPTLSIGSHIVKVYFIDSPTGTAVLQSTTTVTRANQPVGGHLDIANSHTVAGWAYDPDAGTNPVAVSIVLDGAIVATITANAPRTDLSSMLGSPNHGFNYQFPAHLLAGTHYVQVYALDNPSNTPTFIGGYTFQSAPTAGATPLLAMVDIANANIITGWAHAPTSPSTVISVRLVIDGVTIGTTLANEVRPDLAPLGSTQKGYTFATPATLSSGEHSVALYFSTDPNDPNNIATVVLRSIFIP